MKVVFWSDVHLEHSVRSNNINGVKQSVLVLDVLEEKLIEEKPDWVIVNGDLFDKHGIIEASLAVHVKNRIKDLTKKLGVKFLLITGNHEYPEVKEEYFGNGLLTALFGGMEDQGIFVVDEKARFIRLDETHVALGIPYRETWEQYEATCHVPITEALASGVVDKNKDRVIIGWHVGLPWGQAWHDGEDENAWIREDHEAVKLLFSLAHDNRIFCGHYHGPDNTPCGDLGIFTYIGSPATRTRSESGQIKRVGVWEDGLVRFQETGLALDQIVSSVEEAIEHREKLISLFGVDVLKIATVHINLGEGASMDDFSVARMRVSKLSGKVYVDRPKVIRKGVCDHIVEQHKNDPSSSREKLELDILRFSIRHHFKNLDFKGLDEDVIEAMIQVPYRMWKKGYRSGGSADSLKVLEDCLLAVGLSKEKIPALNSDFCNQAARLSLTSELSEQITARV